MSFAYDGFIDLIPLFNRPADELYTVTTLINEDGSLYGVDYIYDDAVQRLLELIDRNHGYKNCYQVLEEAKIEPNEVLDSGDFSRLNASQTFALMTWLARAERFCDGRIADAIQRHQILGLLEHLRGLTESTK